MTTRTRQLRVALVTGSLPDMPCGVGDYTARLADALIDAGIFVRVVTSSDARIAPARFEIAPDIDEWGLCSMPHLLRGLRAARADVIHLQYPTAGYRQGLAPGLLLPLLRILAPHTRLVATIHEYRHTTLKNRLYVAATIHWAHTIIAPDAGQLDGLPFCPRRRIVEIPLASNVEPVDGPRAPQPETGELTVGTWGFLRPQKGIESLIDAFEELASRQLARLVIAGDPGPDTQYSAAVQRRIAASPNRNLITVTGRLPQEELSRVLGSFDVCVLPFVAGLEMNRGTYATAVAHGLYVITTSRTRTGFDETSNTLFVSPGDRRQLVGALERARDHPRTAPLDPRVEWRSIAERHIGVYAR
jgi:glycosyltransferase involved in cell wall biosynthesis